MPKIAALPRKPTEKPAADEILCAGRARQASGGTRVAPKKWQPGPTQFRSKSGNRRTYCFLSSQSRNVYTSYTTRRIRLILPCRSRNGKRQFQGARRCRFRKCRAPGVSLGTKSPLWGGPQRRLHEILVE